MRFLYKVILGLLIFNSMLLLLAGYFPTSSTLTNVDDVTNNPEYTQYDIEQSTSIFTWETASGTIMGVAIGLGIIGSWAIKSTVPLAAATLSGITASLYVGPAAILHQITQNTLVTGIISLIGILLGILVGFTILEWFANQQGAD